MKSKEEFTEGLYYLTDIEREVSLAKGKDGFIIASCPEIKGCHSQGKNFNEAIENIKDAIGGCLESLEEEQASLTIDHPGFQERRISFEATTFTFAS